MQDFKKQHEGKISFLNLSREECQAINQKILDNGHILLGTAQHCSSQNNHGLALSLTILGAEEYLKGMILYFNGIGINVFTIQELRGLLSNHKNRHEMACLMELLRIIEMIITVDSIEVTKRANTSLIDDLISLANTASVVLKSVVGITDNINWWEKADDYKKRGLYVGYDGALLLPSSITKEEYDTANKIVTELINSFRVIKIAFERMSPDELQRTLEDINKGLAIMASKNQKSNKEMLKK